MPKAWSEDEKEHIRSVLQREGRTLFERFGLRKTTVEDLAGAAGISKGAFYLFYESKEELYFDIIEAVEREFKKNLFNDVFRSGESRYQSLRRFFRRFFDLLITVPIYRGLSSRDYEYLMRKLPGDTVERHMNGDLEETARYFGEWMERGYIRKMDLETLNGLLMSLVFLILHRDDIGSERFDAVKEIWVEMICQYLLKDG